MIYTNWNLTLCIAALFKRSLVPYAFVNSCAIFVAFHAGLILEPTAYENLLRWNGVDSITFWIGDFVVHGIPLCTYWLMEPGYDLNYKHGIVTAVSYIGWAYGYNGSIFLDSAYVKADPSVWILLWILSTITHLGTPNLLSMILGLRHNNGFNIANT
jgi:hypothetical protein